MGVEAACDPRNVSVSLRLPLRCWGGGFSPSISSFMLNIQFNTILIVL